MPLRGKILNTWEVESTQILASQEVHDIAVALGVDPGYRTGCKIVCLDKQGKLLVNDTIYLVGSEMQKEK